MQLSIITVNLNNCEGLKRTIDSVVSQTFLGYEWIVIDGGSSDGSRELIDRSSHLFSYWVSEPDTGVYNAMNKGIKIAKGDYLLFLNSGDWLFDSTVLERVFAPNYQGDILFASKYMARFKDGRSMICEREYGNSFSPFNIIRQTINHQSAFIKRDLFDKYGYYDESYRIIADRKFFFETILLHNATTIMLDFIVVNFDAEGICNTLDSSKEKERLICEFLPNASVKDYYEDLGRIDYINLHKRDIDVYSELRKHTLIRKIMHFCYRLYTK